MCFARLPKLPAGYCKASGVFSKKVSADGLRNSFAEFELFGLVAPNSPMALSQEVFVLVYDFAKISSSFERRKRSRPIKSTLI